MLLLRKVPQPGTRQIFSELLRKRFSVPHRLWIVARNAVLKRPSRSRPVGHGVIGTHERNSFNRDSSLGFELRGNFSYRTLQDGFRITAFPDTRRQATIVLSLRDQGPTAILATSCQAPRLQPDGSACTCLDKPALSTSRPCL
jgi:hypothetical protein